MLVLRAFRFILLIFFGVFMFSNALAQEELKYVKSPAYQHIVAFKRYVKKAESSAEKKDLQDLLANIKYCVKQINSIKEKDASVKLPKIGARFNAVVEKAKDLEKEQKALQPAKPSSNNTLKMPSSKATTTDPLATIKDEGITDEMHKKHTGKILFFNRELGRGQVNETVVKKSFSLTDEIHLRTYLDQCMFNYHQENHKTKGESWNPIQKESYHWLDVKYWYVYRVNVNGKHAFDITLQHDLRNQKMNGTPKYKDEMVLTSFREYFVRKSSKKDKAEKQFMEGVLLASSGISGSLNINVSLHIAIYSKEEKKMIVDNNKLAEGGFTLNVPSQKSLYQYGLNMNHIPPTKWFKDKGQLAQMKSMLSKNNATTNRSLETVIVPTDKWMIHRDINKKITHRSITAIAIYKLNETARKTSFASYPSNEWLMPDKNNNCCAFVRYTVCEDFNGSSYGAPYDCSNASTQMLSPNLYQIPCEFIKYIKEDLSK